MFRFSFSHSSLRTFFPELQKLPHISETRSVSTPEAFNWAMCSIVNTGRKVIIGKLYFSRKIWKWKFIFIGIFASRGGELLIGEGRARSIANFTLKITKIKSRVVPQNNKIGLNDPAQDDLLRSLWAITIRSWQRFCRTCCSWRVARVNHSRSLGQWLCNQVIK